MEILEALKPEKFEDIVGQRHLFEKGALFRRLVESGNFLSLILIGPPGSGKTSIAEIVGKYHALNFYRIHAANCSVNDIRKIVEETKGVGRESIVFIDEIHHFNKSQQNLLLNIIDEKFVKLIGASTENPYYNLIPPLRSRSVMFELNRLTDSDLRKLISKAVEWLKGRFSAKEIVLDEIVEKSLIMSAGGDARKLLISLESMVIVAPRENGIIYLRENLLEKLPQNLRFSVDDFYHLLSAMIKSIRGSDPDAALLWAFKLLKSGVDPKVIFRRLLILASEDIGNAMPDALVFVNSGYDAFEKVGLPEGEIILAHVITYLASCPKSNKSYLAMKSCKQYLKSVDPVPPKHLKSDSDDYKYPFDYGEFVKQVYHNESVIFYKPMDVGFESKIRSRLMRLWDSRYDEK